MKGSIAAGQFRPIERIIGLYPFGFNRSPDSFYGCIFRRIGKIYNAVEDLILDKNRRPLCRALGVLAPQGALFAFLHYNIGCRGFTSTYHAFSDTPIWG